MRKYRVKPTVQYIMTILIIIAIIIITIISLCKYCVNSKSEYDKQRNNEQTEEQQEKDLLKQYREDNRKLREENKKYNDACYEPEYPSSAIDNTNNYCTGDYVIVKEPEHCYTTNDDIIKEYDLEPIKWVRGEIPTKDKEYVIRFIAKNGKNYYSDDKYMYVIENPNSHFYYCVSSEAIEPRDKEGE